jgi:hypothetical protein
MMNHKKTIICLLLLSLLSSSIPITTSTLTGSFNLVIQKDDGDAYQSVTSDSKFTYVACGGDGLRIYNKTSHNLLATVYDGGYYMDVAVYGNFIFVACADSGLYSYWFNYVSDLNYDLAFNDSDYAISYENYYSVYVDITGTYVYATCGGEGIVSYTYATDGSLTLAGLDMDGSGTYDELSGDDTYLYVTTYDDLYAYTFDGADFTLEGSISADSEYYDVMIDNTYHYIYTATEWGIVVYTFNGTDFTNVYTTDDITGDDYNKIWLNDTLVYFAIGAQGIICYTLYNGVNMVPLDTIYPGIYCQSIGGDSSYIYYIASDDGFYFYTFSTTGSAMIPPTVSTSPATGIGYYNATLHGTITNDGGEGSTVGFEYGQTTGYGTNVSPPPTYLYAGGLTTYKVYQYYNNLTKKTETADYGDAIMAIAEDKNYIYAGGYTTQKVYQYWKTNMTKKAETADYGGTINAITQDYLYIYAGGATTNKVYQYWKSNMTKKAETLTYGGVIFALAEDDNYIYAGGDTTKKVYQYLKSDMSKKAETGSYGGTINAITVDTKYIFVAGATTLKVYQYLKTDMSLNAYTLSYGGSINALTQDDTYVYAGGATTRTIRQYYKSNMTKKAESATYGGTISALAEDKTYVYAGGATTQTIRQYYKNNMTYKTQSGDYGGGIRGIIVSKKYYTGDTFSYNITGLTQGTTYHYRAYGNNSVGGTKGLDAQFTTLAPLSAPTVTTDSASGITSTTATLDGTLTDDGGETCTVWFEYGTTPAYGNTSTNTTKTTGETFSIPIATLIINTTYHYRAYANNTNSTTTGIDRTFKTLGFSTPGVTTTSPATGISMNNATLHGLLTDDGGQSCTVRFQYGYTTSYGTTTANQTKTIGQTFQQNTLGLNAGRLYHYQAIATNTNGTAYGTDQTLLTKPNTPTISAITRTGTGFTLTWVKGTGANNTVIRGAQGGYPANITDGILIYNNTGTTTNHYGLTAGDTWYYRAWSYTTWGALNQYSDTYSQNNKLYLTSPIVTTVPPATGIGYWNATIHGVLTDDGGETCTAWFQYGLTTSYGTTTYHQTKTTGQSFIAQINLLSYNTTYHYRTVAQNTNGTTYGADQTFTTGSSGGVVNTDWTSIFDGIGRMFTGGNYTDSNGIYHSVTGIFGGGFDSRSLLGIFIFMILFILTAMYGMGILIGSVAIIPSVFAVIGYLPDLTIIVAIIVGLVFGLGLNRLIRR